MFPFRPSRAATALLELAEAMLAPEALEQPAGDRLETAPRAAGRELDAPPHPHRRDLSSERRATERRRRPAPPQPNQACVAPLTRAAHARAAQRA